MSVTLDDCRDCDGVGHLDQEGEEVCAWCEGECTDPVWREGRAARRDGQPRTANPYMRSSDIERWAAGWLDAERSIGSGAPR